MRAKYFFYGMVFLIVLSVISVTCKMCSTASRYVNNGIETAYQEYKPEELLRKYEWFKDASAQLDAKLASLSVYQKRFNAIKTSYGSDSLNRKQWSREDKQQWNIWDSECAGIAASYNTLAADYNSQMAKFNYRFCNIGTLPQGATTVLPREYKPYINLL